MTLSSNEVVALSGIDESRLRKDVEYGVVDTSSPPRFSLADVVYFSALAKLSFDLGVADRKRLRQQIVAALEGGEPPVLMELGEFFAVRLRELFRAVKERKARFEAWTNKLHITDEILAGEPVFPGTRLAVRHIGALMVRGVDPLEIREDYPTLSDEDLEFARMFATAYPRRGRPPGSETPAR